MAFTRKKILFIANPFSIHTQRLQEGLSKRGFDIRVFGQKTAYNNKYLFLKMIPSLKKEIRTTQPDLIHAHFASNYGFLGATAGFHPFIISTWGEDIYHFPKQSFLRKTALKWTLSRANAIFATSQALADETEKYTSKKTQVTPFGIDTQLFTPFPGKLHFDEQDFVIGTIKSLYPVYGIENLILAFAKLKKEKVHPRLKLLIVGKGPLEEKFRNLFKELKIDNEAFLAGHIEHKKLPAYYNTLDIAVFPSHREAFGVSILEALSCEKATVVSDLPALREVTANGEAAVIAKAQNVDDLAEKIKSLIENPELKRQKETSGRKRVCEHYNWENNLDSIANSYLEILNPIK